MFRFFIIIGAVPVVLTLVQRGVLSVEQAGGLLVALVIAVAVVGSLMRILLPLFALALFITYNATSTRQIEQLSGSLLTLVLVLLGIFIMARGTSKE